MEVEVCNREIQRLTVTNSSLFLLFMFENYSLRNVYLTLDGNKPLFRATGFGHTKNSVVTFFTYSRLKGWTLVKVSAAESHITVSCVVNKSTLFMSDSHGLTAECALRQRSWDKERVAE